MNADAGTIYNAEELRRYRMEDSERDMLCFLYVHHTSGALHGSTPTNPTDGDEYMRIRRLILSQTIFTDMGSYSRGTR